MLLQYYQNIKMPQILHFAFSSSGPPCMCLDIAVVFIFNYWLTTAVLSRTSWGWHNYTSLKYKQQSTDGLQVNQFCKHSLWTSWQKWKFNKHKPFFPIIILCISVYKLHLFSLLHLFVFYPFSTPSLTIKCCPCQTCFLSSLFFLPYLFCRVLPKTFKKLLCQILFQNQQLLNNNILLFLDQLIYCL